MLMVVAFLVVVAGMTLAAAVLYNGRVVAETNLAKSALLGGGGLPFVQPITLKTVTFNIQDLYIVSNHRPERMRAIAQTLTRLDPDLVGIQESFIDKDRAILLDALAGSRLAYHQYYESATFGCGLLILSAHPLVEPFFHRYVKNGKWYKFFHGDWWAGKGAALARIALPGGGYLDFYNTHTHARYGTTEYDGHQESQMRELAQFIRASALGWAPALLVGDMNCSIGSQAYQIASRLGGLERLMNIASRIDHIFGIRNPHYTYEVLETREIRAEIDVPGGRTELSDHPGYMSTIRIVPNAVQGAIDTARPVTDAG